MIALRLLYARQRAELERARSTEEGRKLNTGHDDDVQFDPASGKAYLFGVSMFSLYGNPLDTSTPNLYGMGRISEPLRLKFQ